MIRLTIIIAAAALAGCNTLPTRFSGEGKSQQQFLADRYQCMQENRSTRGVLMGGDGVLRERTSCSGFDACLASKGYVASAGGNLTAPDGVRCH